MSRSEAAELVVLFLLLDGEVLAVHRHATGIGWGIFFIELIVFDLIVFRLVDGGFIPGLRRPTSIFNCRLRANEDTLRAISCRSKA